MEKNNLQFLAYISHSLIPAQLIESELDSIIEISKRKNIDFSITGVLFFHNNVFLQIFEGEKQDVDALMDNILKDERHQNVEILVNEPITERSFSDYNMDSFNLSRGNKFDYELGKKIAIEFKQNLVPRAGAFVDFYKALLEKSSVKDL